MPVCARVLLSLAELAHNWHTTNVKTETLALNMFANTTFSARILSLQKIPPTLVMNLASENYCKPA